MYNQEQVTAQGDKFLDMWHKEDSKSEHADSRVDYKDTSIYLGRTTRDQLFGGSKQLSGLLKSSVEALSPEQKAQMAAIVEDEGEEVEWEKENCW